MDRLHRIRLLVGDAGVTRLQQATVMVVGCGAVGSFAIEALARSGIGRIILIDFDKVEESNINRQLFATQRTIGMPKVDAARDRIADICPDIAVDTYPIFFDADTALDIQPDFVIDAIDTVESKIALYKWCAARNISFIASMGAARKRDISQIKLSSLRKTSVCPLAAKIRKMARADGLPDFPVVFSTEPAAPQKQGGKNLGSIITVTGAFGLTLAGAVIDHIIAGAAPDGGHI